MGGGVGCNGLLFFISCIVIFSKQNSCELFFRQTCHMKCQTYFFLVKIEKKCF